MEPISLNDVPRESPADETIPDGAVATSIGGARQLADALSVEGFALNHFELEPGQSTAHSIHKHPVQEEVFLVLSGSVSVERPGAADDVHLTADDLLRVPPDTFQFVVNRSDEPATLLALGAPREYQERSRYLIDCPACETETEQTIGTREPADGDRVIVCECEACDAETHRIPV